MPPNSEGAEALVQKILAAGEAVRTLKGSASSDKAAVDAAVAALLALKTEYKTLTGSDYNPPKEGGKDKKKGGKKDEAAPAAAAAPPAKKEGEGEGEAEAEAEGEGEAQSKSALKKKAKLEARDKAKSAKQETAAFNVSA